MSARSGILLLALVTSLLVLPLASCSGLPMSPGPATVQAVPIYTYEIINTYPHDQKAFTQGLVFSGGALYEGTGLYGASTLRRVDLETGEVLQIRKLPEQLFGEGITIWRDRIIQLTWREGIGFVYDKNSFELLEQFTYSTEGWGITHDGNHLVMSDGTSTLYFLHPDNFKETGRIEVSDNFGPVTRLNELEYVRGEIYANVWLTNRIARLSPTTGKVIGWIEMDGLLGQEELREPVDVLNGIAYDAENDRLFVTGKLWPKVFEIKLVPLE
ncbi:MAG: glutaminyl-peptide cyclotransferase [Chloroflexi bacterium]|nr:glutaminyl-peptide cyclotransferase [Chloroflexota bacterium]